MAILEDHQSGYIHILYHTFKLHPSVVVVVPQRIWLARISVVCVARLTTPRNIRVESQGLVKFILKIHNIFSSNIPDTLGERVPQITCSPGKRAISSLPRSTPRGETWYVTYASTPATCSKSQAVFIGNVWDQVLFYFIQVDDFKPLISPLDAVHAKFFQTLGIIQSFHSIDLSGKRSQYLLQKVYFLDVGWSRWPHWGAIIQTWSDQWVPDGNHG